MVLPDLPTSGTTLGTVPQIQLRGNNVQANLPSGDYVQQFPGYRPYVRATQSEVSTAAFGKHVVLGYNNSAGLHIIPNPSGPGLIVDRVQLSGFAASGDGGQTWTNGFLPPSPNGQTFGDPSVGVDRHGRFYYATLAADEAHGTIQVNSSIDGGVTWSEGVVVQQDDGSDKEWLAVVAIPFRRPRQRVRDVDQLSDDGVRASLRPLDRWRRHVDREDHLRSDLRPESRTPAELPAVLQSCRRSVTGTLYVPFLRYSNADQDFIQMMVSDDAGDTFHFATFNQPGAPNPTVLPVTQPGELTSCGGTNIRLTIHGTANPGPGRFGFPDTSMPRA